MTGEKVFVKDYMPMFRDADAQGRIGIRAYMSYFQDMATEHLYHMEKGNDTLPEKYGAAWIYTRYKMQVGKRADFSRKLHMETWIEKQDKLRICQDLRISADGQVFAMGRLESCVIHLQAQKIGRLSDIEMPQGMTCDTEKIELAPFMKFKRDIAGMEYIYSHKVRYSDLDKSQHMANLRYVNLMENVFSPEFYEEHSLKEFELHYISQSFYGDEIRIYKSSAGERHIIAGNKEDGGIVFLGTMGF
ncbi:MAG: acyl-[acyl-carrier-protein] thioesterase [Ruminococcus sp.]